MHERNKNFRMIDLRKKADLTQQELGAIVGLNQAMISNVENGMKEPSKKYRIAIAKALNTSVAWLFYEDFNV